MKEEPHVDKEQILGARDLAKLLGTTPCAIYLSVHRRDGIIPPFFHRGSRVCWRLSSIQQWLSEKEKEEQSLGIFPKTSRRGRPRKKDTVYRRGIQKPE